MNDLKLKAEQLRAELKEVEKQIADAENYYPKICSYVYALYFDGSIGYRKFRGDALDRAVFDQGNWLDTKYKAELTRDYRVAVVRINRAIRNDEKGIFMPAFYGNFGWQTVYTSSQSEFASGSSKTIEKVLVTHKADFDVIAEYRKVMLA